MSNKFKLQLPMTLDLKNRVEAIAEEEGFDSVQSFARFVFTKIARREVAISVINTPDEILSHEETKRLNALHAEAMFELEKDILPNFDNAVDLINFAVNEKKNSYNKTISKTPTRKNERKSKVAKKS